MGVGWNFVLQVARAGKLSAYQSNKFGFVFNESCESVELIEFTQGGTVSEERQYRDFAILRKSRMVSAETSSRYTTSCTTIKRTCPLLRAEVAEARGMPK